MSTKSRIYYVIAATAIATTVVTPAIMSCLKDRPTGVHIDLVRVKCIAAGNPGLILCALPDGRRFWLDARALPGETFTMERSECRKMGIKFEGDLIDQ